MNFDVLDEGFVIRRNPHEIEPVAVGSRCAVAPNGDLVCSYSLQSALGINDFVPNISRSTNGGNSWSEQGAIWPNRKVKFSIIGSVSLAPTGDLFFYGIQIPIDTPGELFSRKSPSRIKQNDLIWAKSTDHGWTWSEPQIISKPTTGSAEAPGPMCVTRSGRWLACYVPYRSFDQSLEIDRRQIVVVSSDDQGTTWSGQSMLRFDPPQSSGSEAWVVELADGKLLGACWHINEDIGEDYPNACAVSTDNANSWGPTHATGILGQSPGLAELPDGRALMVYNQRKQSPYGVRLALAEIRENKFHRLADQLVWQAESPTQSQSSGNHVDWEDFAFGEPSVTVLNQNELLVTLWCIQPSRQGIRYIRLGILEK